MPRFGGTQSPCDAPLSDQCLVGERTGFLALTEMGTDKLSSDEADSLLKLVDKDGDGLVDYEEFARLILGNGQPGTVTLLNN